MGFWGFGVSSVEAGVWLGSAALVAGGFGALAAGFLTDLLTILGRRAAAFETGMVAATALALTMALVLVVPIPGTPIIIVGSALLFGSFSMPPSVAVVQTIPPPELRSRISGILLIMNILGQTAGNALVGFLNDRVFGAPYGIRTSLPLFLAFAAILALIILSRGRKAAAVLASEG